MAQTWEELLFAHWPLPVEELRAHVPPELELDTYDGVAYLGVTPFRITNLRLRGLPPVPRVSSFLELNCRTYVSHGGEKPGIWFFSLDAASRLAVEAARRLYRLPYFQARMSGPPHYTCVRQGAARPHEFDAVYRPAGAVAPAGAGTLEHFLAERYCLYTHDEGRLWRGEIHHLPWPLQDAEAEIAVNTMPPDGLEVSGDAHLMSAGVQDVLIWPLQPVH
jgi:uncharacterized protein YqjF (DUF2071 family)